MIRLPHVLESRLESLSAALLQPAEGRRIDFTQPPGEASFATADSLSWRIFKNPIALLVGGITAVILELAEPAVRTGVWKLLLVRHGSLRKAASHGTRRHGDRLRRAQCCRTHDCRHCAHACPRDRRNADRRNVLGKRCASLELGACHRELWFWRCVQPATCRRSAGFDFDRLYAEGAPAARCYGALDIPTSEAEWQALLLSMRGRLEPSDILMQFLRIMGDTPAFPTPLRWMQPMLVRAAIDLVPEWLRDTLGLTPLPTLTRIEKRFVKLAGTALDRIVLPGSPPSQSCRRLGLPSGYLYAPYANDRGRYNCDTTKSSNTALRIKSGGSKPWLKMKSWNFF
jgi:uncharacterized protein (DUF2236 family)